MTGSDHPPSLDELAKRYLDLWQDQMSALAADPETARLMGRSLQLWASAGPAGWQAIWQAAADGLKGQPGTMFDHAAFAPFFQQQAPQADRPKAAGSASGDGGGGVAELRRRLAELETRVAGLAPEPRSAGKGARKRPRKDRAG
ncbi:MAG: hypothetical protein ACKO1J_02390 [Tagaea sp.]